MRWFVTAIVFLAFWGSSARSASDVRETATVRLIEKVAPAIVPIFTQGPDGSIGSGTGTLIHENGFILTADHVTQDFPGVGIEGVTRHAYEVIGRLPEKDIAILRLQPGRKWPFVPLGRSHDCRVGEPIVVGGNPGGRGLVFSRGIVSSASIDPTWPSLLAKTHFQTIPGSDGRDDFIQFDAASNRGNSGGPLINARGEMIGVVASKKFDEEAINWAIPADRIRRLFGYLVQPEEVSDFWTGLQVDLLAPQAQIISVAANSPAADAGLQSGDILLSVNGSAVRSGPDWLMLLTGRKSGHSLKLICERNNAKSETRLKLAPYPVEPPASVDNAKPGLKYAVHRGPWRYLPDFGELEPVDEGIAEQLGADPFVEGDKDHYALRFTGFMKVPEEGLYRLTLGSDDGSKLYLRDRLLIDIDGTHPVIRLSRRARLGKGLVPIAIEFLESTGVAHLELTVESLEGDEPRQVPAEFFH